MGSGTIDMLIVAIIVAFPIGLAIEFVRSRFGDEGKEVSTTNGN